MVVRDRSGLVVMWDRSGLDVMVMVVRHLHMVKVTSHGCLPAAFASPTP